METKTIKLKTGVETTITTHNGISKVEVTQNLGKYWTTVQGFFRRCGRI